MISPVGTSLDTFGTEYIVRAFRFGSTCNHENNSDIMPPDNDSHHDGDIDMSAITLICPMVQTVCHLMTVVKV